MAKPVAVWGIDIGESALKALRCKPSAEAGRIEADAFDYIEYPKILSQPDANRAELVLEALQQFLSRNSVRGDKVVMSVSGQNGLARFIKLPPVESKKIPDIVRYEARQQIPFPLEDVVWDFQQMGGGAMEEGFALDSEVGLFAMKRDVVYKLLAPFDAVGIEVDIVQLTPLALYNYIVYDQMPHLPKDEDFDPDNPPESIVVLSLGTDTTDLVVTNGFRVWQRSIAVGGNHFTKALVKELKLNFATAEHMKRNASQAQDPKTLFQAMRPVFKDLVDEVQRSIGYFKNMDKRANIARVVALGNVMRLPGLPRYLSQNLGVELQKVDSFRGLSGAGVVDQPAFKENLLAFGVCYGLCLQGLKQARLRTNLLPPEIAQFRMIRAKKPWVVAAAALLLLGSTVSFAMHYNAVQSVAMNPPGSAPGIWPDELDFNKPILGDARKGEEGLERFVADARKWNDDFEAAKVKFKKTEEVGESLLQNSLNRDMWLRFLKAVNLALPRNPPGADGKSERPKEIVQRTEIKVDSIECRWVSKLEDWYAATLDHRRHESAGGAPAAPATPGPAPEPPADPGLAEPPPAPAAGGPTGPGWVFEITAHHYRNVKEDPHNQGIQFVRNTLLKNLSQDELPVPSDGSADAGRMWPVKKLGIAHPVLIEVGPVNWSAKIKEDGEAEAPAAGAGLLGGGLGGGATAAPKEHVQPRYDFKVQFCWQPVPAGRQHKRPSAQEAAVAQRQP